MQIDAAREWPAAGRLGLVHRSVIDALATVASAASGARPRLLDCGGGSGTFAVPLAQAGADVTVVDISADALATLRRRAHEAGVSALVHPVQGDVEALDLDPDGFDAVLAHGILEAVDNVGAVFAGLVAAVSPGGLLSVLVSNPAAAVLGRAIAGELRGALQGLEALYAVSSRLGPDAVADLCAAAGLVVESRRGIGAFSDFVPGSALDAPEAHDTLARLDALGADRAPFAHLAGRVHLLARRPRG